MPTYEYVCSVHGRYEMPRKMEERDSTYNCPACGRACERVMSVPAKAVVEGGTGAQAGDRS